MRPKGIAGTQNLYQFGEGQQRHTFEHAAFDHAAGQINGVAEDFDMGQELGEIDPPEEQHEVLGNFSVIDAKTSSNVQGVAPYQGIERCAGADAGWVTFRGGGRFHFT